MAFCTNCGLENPKGAHFCSSCGMEMIPQNSCPSCGKALGENEKFCSGCGAPVNNKSAKQPPKVDKPEEPKYTKEGRKIITGGPKPTPNQLPKNKEVTRKSTPKKKTREKSAKKNPTTKNRFDKKTVQQKKSTSNYNKPKKKKTGRIILRLLILVIVIWGGIKIINLAGGWIGGLSSNSTNVKIDDYAILMGNGISLSISQIKRVVDGEKPIKTESKAVDEKNTVAKFDNATVNFGEFNLDEPNNCKIEKYPDKEIGNECKISVYDFSLENQHQFDDYLTITLPYDANYIQRGNVENCVAAQYFNEKTNEWEPVIFDIDSKNKQVIIQTDHLSKYGVFTVKNDGMRDAYISTAYISDIYLKRYKKGMHIDVLENYYENDRSLGKEAINYGLSFWGQFSGQSGVAINTLTVGGMYSTKFTSTLNDGFKNLGYVASVTQLAYDLCYSDNKTTAINLTKNIMNQLVAEFGNASINLAFIGVYFIDVAITKFGNAMLAQKYKELFEVYDYYNKAYNDRKLKEWRTLMINIHRDNPDDPNAAFKEIMDEIEDYSWQFMKKTGIGTGNENTAELNSLAGEAGLKRMAWPSQKDIEGIYGEGKQRIIDKLYPVFVSVNNWRINKQRMELTKEAIKLKKQLNQKVKLTITENLRKGEASKYGDCTVTIRPLKSGVDKKNWTGMLNKSGVTQTFFTYMGHFSAGMPNRVEIYKPGDKPDIDKPIIVKEFTVDEKGEVMIELGELAKSKWVLFDSEVVNKAQYIMVKHNAEMENGSLNASCVSPDPSSNSFSNYTMSAKWTPFKNSYMEGEAVRTKASVNFDGKNASNSVLYILFQTAMNDTEPTDFNGKSDRASVEGELTYSDGREKDKAEFYTTAPKALSKDDVWVISVYGEGSEYKMYYKPQQVDN